MRLLLDTHALAWALVEANRLHEPMRSLVLDPSVAVFVSPVAPWEIAQKHRIGKWPEAPEILAALDAALRRATFTALPITIEHARRAGALPGSHRDPFDRMLAAQSTVEGLDLVSADPVFAEFGIAPLWLGAAS